MFMMPPMMPPPQPFVRTQPESSAADMPMHSKMRCINNTGTLFILHDVEKLKVSAECMKHLANVPPATGTAAKSEPAEAAAPMPPHARQEQPDASHDAFSIDASCNRGSVFALCNVRHVVME